MLALYLMFSGTYDAQNDASMIGGPLQLGHNIGIHIGLLVCTASSALLHAGI